MVLFCIECECNNEIRLNLLRCLGGHRKYPFPANGFRAPFIIIEVMHLMVWQWSLSQMVFICRGLSRVDVHLDCQCLGAFVAHYHHRFMNYVLPK